jgi:hypothetical protein
MLASPKSIALATAAIMALHAFPASAKDSARFVYTPLAPPENNGTVFLTGIYQDQAVGEYSNGTIEEGFTWAGGNYTNVPAVQVFNALSDSGVAIGDTAGSTTTYTTYDLTSGATNTVSFAPPGGYKFSIGGINASHIVSATQFTKMSGKKKPYCQAFEQEPNGSYTWLAKSKPGGLGPIGITDDGIVVMEQVCSPNVHRNAYLYKNGKTKTFTIPGATLGFGLITSSTLPL